MADSTLSEQDHYIKDDSKSHQVWVHHTSVELMYRALKRILAFKVVHNIHDGWHYQRLKAYNDAQETITEIERTYPNLTKG